MEDIYRNNVIEFSLIYIDKKIEENEENEFESSEFTTYIFKQLFNIDITNSGYGMDSSTKQMTNNIGDLKIYKENDTQKNNYINDIKKGDLIFFHLKSLEENSPSTNNRYPGHVGIYMGNNEFIHVSPTHNKIIIDKLENNWLTTLVASRNIIKEFLNKNQESR